LILENSENKSWQLGRSRLETKVMQHFFANLRSGGYLCLGHAESLYQVDDRFHLVHFPGAIGYWRPPVGFVAGGKRWACSTKFARGFRALGATPGAPAIVQPLAGLLRE
jgi:CheR methyltransferase, SAM binding domain